MKRTVEIGAGISYHLNLTDLKLGARRILVLGRRPGAMLANHSRRQALVGDHAVFNAVAHVN